MSRYLKYFIVIACILGVLRMNEAIALDVVVVDSSASDIPAGTVISAGMAINLEAGTEITVLGADGSIGILKGPYRGSISQDTGDGADEGEVISAVKSLITKSNKQSSALGAVRSITSTQATDLWSISVAKSGIYCVMSNIQPKLIRKHSAKSVKLTVKKRKGVKHEVFWAAGEYSIEWPEEVPIEEGAAYLLKLEGQPLPKKIKIYLINEMTENIKMVPMFVKKKCLNQAQIILTRLINQQQK